MRKYSIFHTVNGVETCLRIEATDYIAAKVAAIFKHNILAKNIVRIV